MCKTQKTTYSPPKPSQTICPYRVTMSVEDACLQYDFVFLRDMIYDSVVRHCKDFNRYKTLIKDIKRIYEI